MRRYIRSLVDDKRLKSMVDGFFFMFYHPFFVKCWIYSFVCVFFFVSFDDFFLFDDVFFE